MKNHNLTATPTNFSQSDGIEPLANIEDIINDRALNAETIRTNKKLEYFNIPCCFDIETTSFYDGLKQKRATMYEWTLGINGRVIAGRTWGEFLDTLDVVSEMLQLGKERRLIVYVHNLAFEFQFMRKWFTWEKVFAVNDRKPVYALTDTGIEFRCSYILSGYPLASLGEQLRKYPCEKMVGDLDYTKQRNRKTPLTDKEWKYCENDVRVVMSYIQEKIESDGDITKIPLTNTGYVRNYCRNACMYDGSHKKNSFKFLNYRRLMKSLQLTPDEYEQLKRAFQGGFTHANAFYTGQVVENVESFDFTSSYPAVMVAEQFPMSCAEVVKIRSTADLVKNCNLYCCLFDVEFVGLEASTMFEHPLSRSRCWQISGVTEDNGRVVCAESLRTTITEQDYFIFRKFYTWKKMRIGTFRRYKRGYLPTDFVKAILKLYSDKTTLKGVIGREEDYLRSKGMVNACYGMCVTDICRDEHEYSDSEWSTSGANIEKQIEKENKSVRRFLYFPWGVWVTAYARKNLFSGIYEFGNDYVYSDTDSIKGRHPERHMDYINGYNKRIIEKLERALRWHKIPLDAIRPKTIKGVEKPLGVWDDEGMYTKFKTMGAKRYMVEKKDALIVDKDKPTEKRFDVSLTVSGVNKNFAIPCMVEKYGVDGIFDEFGDDLYIDPDSTGKLTHTYIDEDMTGELTDYMGNTARYYEHSAVHLEKADYTLSLADAYIDYLMGVREYAK